MRKIRIYQPGEYQVGELIELSEEAGQHAGVVLRKQSGDELILFSGNNKEYLTRIETVNKKKVGVLILQVEEQSRESPLQMHLGQAISKGEKMEYIVQKAVELGVSSITPLLTERCAVKIEKQRLLKKQQQWQAIAISACEQCGRNQVPVIHTPMLFNEFVQQPNSATRFILHPEGGKSWRDWQHHLDALTIIIGPEGGLTELELNQASQHDFAPITLGPRVLRTETAAITALSIFQAVFGDL